MKPLFPDKNIHRHVAFGEVVFCPQSQCEFVANDFKYPVVCDTKKSALHIAETTNFLQIGVIEMLNHIAPLEVEKEQSLVVCSYVQGVSNDL